MSKTSCLALTMAVALLGVCHSTLANSITHDVVLPGNAPLAFGESPVRPFRAPKQSYFTYAPNTPEFKMPGDIRLVDLFGPEGDELSRPALPEFTPVRPVDEWQPMNEPSIRVGDDATSTIPAPGGGAIVVLTVAATAVRRRRY